MSASDLEVDKMVKLMQTQYERTHNIFCPYCDAKQDTDTMYQHVTYWGEADEADQLCHCEHCGKKFRVIELVDRIFKTEVIQNDE